MEDKQLLSEFKFVFTDIVLCVAILLSFISELRMLFRIEKCGETMFTWMWIKSLGKLPFRRLLKENNNKIMLIASII